MEDEGWRMRGGGWRKLIIDKNRFLD